MVEHQFAAGFAETATALAAATTALRQVNPATLTLADLETLGRHLETHRLTVSAATARTRAELHNRLHPPPPPDDDTDDTAPGGGDNNHNRARRRPGPRPGDRGDNTGTDHDEARRQARAATVAQILPTAIAALDTAITHAHIQALWTACDHDPDRARRDEHTLVSWARTCGPR